MHLPIILGKDSAGEDFTVNMQSLPNLFVSYCDGQQIKDFFFNLITTLSQNNKIPVSFALATSKNHSWLNIIDCSGTRLKYHYEKEGYSASSQQSRECFMTALLKELKQRQQLIRKSEQSGTITQVSPLIILLHDVFDIIISPKKFIGQAFIQLLLSGKDANIHIVAASNSTYRNLLKQLLHLNPLVKYKYSKQLDASAFQIATDLGAELVITADDFFFFKEANALDYHRLYPRSNKTALAEDVKQLERA